MGSRRCHGETEKAPQESARIKDEVCPITVTVVVTCVAHRLVVGYSSDCHCTARWTLSIRAPGAAMCTIDQWKGHDRFFQRQKMKNTMRPGTNGKSEMPWIGGNQNKSGAHEGSVRHASANPLHDISEHAKRRTIHFGDLLAKGTAFANWGQLRQDDWRCGKQAANGVCRRP